jgi:hypothetical protein
LFSAQYDVTDGDAVVTHFGESSTDFPG